MALHSTSMPRKGLKFSKPMDGLDKILKDGIKVSYSHPNAKQDCTVFLTVDVDVAKQAIINYFISLAPKKKTPIWDDDDGFCTTCEAFLEDDKYGCYCDLRNETIDQFIKNIKDSQEGLR